MQQSGLTQCFPNRFCEREELSANGRTSELCCAPLGAEAEPVFEHMGPVSSCSEENRVSPGVGTAADESSSAC